MRALVLLLALAAGCVYADSYVFTNGHLVTMEDAEVRAGELVVVDGRIAAVGPSADRPDGATVIDMAGGYLMPGLAEMHAHVPAPGQGRAYRDDVLFLWVAGGITTVRGMLGHPDHLQLRADLAAHEVLGPRLITSGPSFNGRSVTSAAQARRMVEAQKAAGYDFLKIHPGVPLAAYDAMAETAHRLGIAFAGHVPAEVGLSHALAQRQLTIDHLDGYIQELVPDLDQDDPALGSFFGAALADRADERRLDAIIDKTLDAGAWVVPTETLLENFADAAAVDELLARPEAAYLPQRLRQGYADALRRGATSAPTTRRYVQLRKRMLKRMHERGVGILLGSDSPQIFNVPGFSIHRELAAMVAAGLTPYEAIATGTVNPAEFFGMADQFGRLRPGLAADLVLVAGNPLADIANAAKIDGVMVRGRWLDRQALELKLEEIAGRYAN